MFMNGYGIPSHVLVNHSLWSSERLVSYRIATRCHNPEDRNLNLHRRENLKSRNPVPVKLQTDRQTDRQTDIKVIMTCCERCGLTGNREETQDEKTLGESRRGTFF
jgi:hypothetical protein